MKIPALETMIELAKAWPSGREVDITDPEGVTRRLTILGPGFDRSGEISIVFTTLSADDVEIEEAIERSDLHIIVPLAFLSKAGTLESRNRPGLN